MPKLSPAFANGVYVALLTCLTSAAVARQAASVPPTPSQLIASAGQSGAILVSWSDDSSLETSFRIQREPSFREGVVEVPAGTVAFVDQPGRGFFRYKVWAVNASGASGVAISDRIQVRNGRVGTHGAVDPGSGLMESRGSNTPVQPARLRAMPGSGTVHLAWQDRSSNETGFSIGRERSVNGEWGGGANFSVAANGTFFDQPVDPGMYRYRIRSVNGLQASAYTSWAIVTVESGGGVPTGQPPAAPSGLTATDIGGGRAMVSWSDNSGNETQFRIQRTPAMSGGTATVGANATAFIDQSGNGTFSYRVFAANTFGSSDTIGPVNCIVTSGSTGSGTSGGGTSGSGNSSGTMASSEGGGTCGGGTSGGGNTGGGSSASLVGTPQFPGLTVGGDGWTVFTPASDTRIVYVSSSSGNDNNTGLSESSPKRTLSAAFALLRDGYPDWMVLKSGDTWMESLPWWGKSGRSVAAPMVIGSYGTGERPLLKTGTSYGFQSAAFVGTPRRHIVLADLHLWAHSNNGAGVNAGVDITNGLSDVLIENCYIEQYATGIAMQGIETRPTNIKIRRTIIANSLSTSGRSTGIILGHADNLLVEECTLDHNGWSETIGGCNPTIFSHNIYINPDNTTGVVVRNSIVARGAASGIRSTGQLCENNLLLQNPVGMALGPDTRIVRNNVFLDSRNIDASNPRGVGMDGTIGANVEIYGNILAHQRSGTGNTKGMNLGGAYSGLQLHDNVVYDWVQTVNNQAPAIALEGTPATQVRVYNNHLQQATGAMYQQFNPVPSGMYVYSGNKYYSSTNNSPFMESPSWMTYNQWLTFSGETGSAFAAVSYPDPNRTIATYMSSIGGSPTLDAFMTEARRQAKGNWRPQYTADAVGAYIRAGFGVQVINP